MKSIASFALLLVLVSCAPKHNDLPPAIPAPTQDVEINELPVELPKTDTVRQRARKLLQVILGGVNRWQ